MPLPMYEWKRDRHGNGPGRVIYWTGNRNWDEGEACERGEKEHLLRVHAVDSSFVVPSFQYQRRSPYPWFDDPAIFLQFKTNIIGRAYDIVVSEFERATNRLMYYVAETRIEIWILHIAPIFFSLSSGRPVAALSTNVWNHLVQCPRHRAAIRQPTSQPVPLYNNAMHP